MTACSFFFNATAIVALPLAGLGYMDVPCLSSGIEGLFPFGQSSTTSGQSAVNVAPAPAITALFTFATGVTVNVVYGGVNAVPLPVMLPVVLLKILSRSVMAVNVLAILSMG